jgi:LCP family protein required for cell wall assembly
MPLRAILRSPSAAALLSFVLPGLGQAAAGHPRRGLVVALPMFGGTAFVAWMLLLSHHRLADILFSTNSLTAFLLVDVAYLLYHVWAIADAYFVALSARPIALPAKEQSKAAPVRRPPRAGRAAAAGLAVLVLVTTSAHLALGAVDLQLRDAMASWFNVDAPSWFGSGYLADGETAPPVDADQTPQLDDPTASATAGGSIASGSASASAGESMAPVTPGPTTADGIPIFPVEQVGGPNTPPSEWAADGLLNILLVGVDEGVGRWSLRTDTMILLEVEQSTGRAVMYGIPRNLENIPLPPESADAYPCHCFPYPNLLNGLWRDAVNRPSAYPYSGSDFVRGFKALEGAIGQYLGLHVDGSVVINLMGFVNLIDALGGLDIYVPTELRDSQYSRPQDGRDITIDIKAGYQHMNGFTALAYARSRHQDSDYGRMARQQAVLLALRAQLHPCALLPQVPSLIGALGDAIWTDMPIEDAPTLVGLAERVGAGNVKSVELVPAVTGNPKGFLTVPRLATVRDIVAHGLDGVMPAPAGGGGGGGLSC